MFNLFDLFRYDHRSWLRGYRHGRSGEYRYCPTLDSTGRYYEILRDVDNRSYAAGFGQGREARLREKS